MTGFLLDLLVASALWSLAAALVESALRAYRRPTRWVWLGAMVLSVGLPVVSRVWPAWSTTLSAVPISALAGLESIGTSDVATHAGGASWIAMAWAIMVLGAVCAGVWSASRLSRRRAAWRATMASGVRVLRSRRFGPAVVGVRRGGIVLPAWVFELDARARRLILLHEGEHARAGDVPLLVAGAAIVALVPWNPIAWIQLRRLRAAVEVDCDLRVLHRGAPVPAYASLLLELPLAHRYLPSPVLAFATPRSLLGRRIDLMTRRPQSPWTRRIRATMTGATALLLTLVACDAAAPNAAVTPQQRVEATEKAALGTLHTRQAQPNDWTGAEPGSDHTAGEYKFRVPGPRDPGANVFLRSDRDPGQLTADGLHRKRKVAAEKQVRRQRTPAPIIMLDGVEVTKAGLQSVGKERIASVDVLKGDAAVAAYGERGRNGVIRVKTKQ